jgi:DNA-binding protein YbaB
MTSAFEAAISEAMAEVKKQRANLARVHEALDDSTVTVRSKRRQLSATVDGRGELVALKFHGDSYRTMAAADLATLVVDTVRLAKQEAQARLWESIADAVPGGADLVDAVSGYDWSRGLDEATVVPEPLVELLNRSAENIFGEPPTSSPNGVPGTGRG